MLASSQIGSSEEPGVLTGPFSGGREAQVARPADGCESGREPEFIVQLTCGVAWLAFPCLRGK